MTTSVLGFLRHQRDLAAAEARRLMEALADGSRSVSPRWANEVECALDDAQRAEERLERATLSVAREPLTYRRDGPHSFFLDMVAARVGGRTQEMATRRLERHRQEVAGEVERRELLARRSFDRAADTIGMTREYRDLTRTDTAGGYFVPPLWLLDELGALPRAGRVVADRVASIPLPAGTDSVSVPRITTGTATAIQTADNAAVQETDAVTAEVAAPVRTIAGQVDASVQLLDQSGPPGFDRLVFADLMADYNAKLGAQLIAGSASAGQVSGLLTSPGTASTYTDATPTAAEAYGVIGDLAASVSTARQMVPNLVVMHPRRGFWLMSRLDTSNRPLTPIDLAAAERDPNVEPVGSMFGMALVLDPSVPTNLGAGTNEDRVIVTRSTDHLLLEGDPRLTVSVDGLSGTLTVRFSLRRYLAFISQRVPSATGVLSGTGLVTPT